MVVPGVVEESEALVDGRMHDADGLVVVVQRADVPTAETQDRHALPGPPEQSRVGSPVAEAGLWLARTSCASVAIATPAAACFRNSRRVVESACMAPPFIR